MDEQDNEYTETYIPSDKPKKPQEIIKTPEFRDLLHQLPEHTTPIQAAATLTGMKEGCVTTIPEGLEEEILDNLQKLNISYHKIFDQLLFTRDKQHLKNHLQTLEGTELTDRFTPIAVTEEDLGRFLGVPEEDLVWWEDYGERIPSEEYSEHLDETPDNWEHKHLPYDVGMQLSPQPTKESVEHLIAQARSQQQLTYYLYDEHGITPPINTILNNQIQRKEYIDSVGRLGLF